MKPARFAIACALSTTACSGATQVSADAKSEAESLVGKPAPAVEWSALHGSPRLELSSLRGKVVLLDLWASWCTPCQESLPLLDDLAARLDGEGVEIVGISVDESRADADAFLARRSHWALTLGHDPEQKLVDRLQPPEMPTSYVIDRQGVVRSINAGFEPSHLRQLEQRLLALGAEP
jgi:cytochrome c biogenesis protein CcmG, thiol:disulfide interchange protein DsbE